MPEYNIHPGDIMIMFKAAPGRSIYSTPQSKVNERVNERVNEKEQSILNLISNDPGYTVSQLSEKLSVSRKTVAAHLKALKEKGIIERIGSARNGYWRINT